MPKKVSITSTKLFYEVVKELKSSEDKYKCICLVGEGKEPFKSICATYALVLPGKYLAFSTDSEYTEYKSKFNDLSHYPA